MRRSTGGSLTICAPRLGIRNLLTLRAAFSGKVRRCRTRSAICPSLSSRLAALLLAAAAPSVAPAADMAGPVDIGGGREMYVECRGDGAPAVVIVAGAKASAADWTEARARRAERL